MNARLLLSAVLLTAIVVPTSGALAQRPPVHRLPIAPQGGYAHPFNLKVAPPAQPGTCAAPTLTQCKDVNYLVSACGQANQTACQTLLKPEYEAYWNGIPVPVDRPMFGYGKPTTFGNLRNGKFAGAIIRPTSKTSPHTVFGALGLTAHSPPPQMGAARPGANQSVTTIDPRTYVPDPTWEANGNAVESCEEYVFEKYYDYSRWDLAVKYCGRDLQCVLDVAYVGNNRSGAPRIADRVLKSKDGTPLAEQYGATLPTQKNVFFARGARYLGVTAVVLPGEAQPFITFEKLKAQFPQFAADLDELRAALDAGSTFYAPKGRSTENYANGWAYHAAMRPKVKNVSDNEFEEFARRRDELEALLALAEVPPNPPPTATPKRGIAPPGDLVTVQGGDPFARLSLWGNDTARNQRQAAFARNNGLSPHLSGIKGMTPGAGGAVRFAIPESIVGAPTAAILAAPMYQPPPIAGAWSQTDLVDPATPQLACPAPQIMSPDQGARSGLHGQALDHYNAVQVALHARCKILNLTLAEWWRLKFQRANGGCNDRGSCGCLDLNSYACDWSPKMFSDAYAKQPLMSSQRELDYQYCKKWSYRGFPNLPAQAKSGTQALEQYLHQTEAAIQAKVKNIPRPEPTTSPGLFGQNLGHGETYGDPDSFSAGYEYDLGWQVKANEWCKTPTNDTRPAKLEGIARALFWVKMTTPIDGKLPDSISAVWNHAVDADAWVRVNENKNHKLRFETHFVLGSYELFSVPDGYVKNGYKKYKDGDAQTYVEVELNHTYKKPLLDDHIGIPDPALSLTVMAGPVPITGAVWVELRYGADFTAKAEIPSKPPTPQECADGVKLYEASLGVVPHIALDAAMTLGVGIKGLVYAGIRGDLNLLTASLPINAATWLGFEGQTSTVYLQFETDAKMIVSTLSGRLALFLEFLMWSHEFEIFHWSGLGPYTIPLFKVMSEKLELFSLAGLERTTPIPE